MADHPDLTGVTLTGDLYFEERDGYAIRFTLKNGSSHALEILPVLMFNFPSFGFEAVNAATGEQLDQVHALVCLDADSVTVPPGGTFIGDAPLCLDFAQVEKTLAETDVEVTWHCPVIALNLKVGLNFDGQVVIPRHGRK
jgi:hypothetical protein